MKLNNPLIIPRNHKVDECLESASSFGNLKPLEKFLEVYSVLSPDVITGWNSKLFDMAYLIRRMQKLFDDKK